MGIRVGMVGIRMGMRRIRRILTPTPTLEFLGVEIHAHKILLSLPKEKAENMKTQCRYFFDNQTVTVWGLRKLIRRLSSIVAAVTPAPVQYPSLKHHQIQGRIAQNSWDGKVDSSMKAVVFCCGYSMSFCSGYKT